MRDVDTLRTLANLFEDALQPSQFTDLRGYLGGTDVVVGALRRAIMALELIEHAVSESDDALRNSLQDSGSNRR